MMGKFLSLLILISALVAGAGIYYTQVYAFYDEVPATGVDDVQLLPKGAETPETILYEDFRAIDSASSPIRYRACFTTPTPLEALSDRYAAYRGASPRVAPGWFDCFDAEAIGDAIEAGRARVFTAERNIDFGIDRVVAVTDAGRGYVWHEINECGDKAYDGTPLGDDCPRRP